MQPQINVNEISPFEVKNLLLDAAGKAVASKQSAQGSHARVLNAGRGNPNFLNTSIRLAHSLLTTFGCVDAKANYNLNHIGLRPRKKEIAKRLTDFLNPCDDQDSAAFLQQAIAFVQEHAKIGPDEVVFELVDAALGDFYPMPPRIFPIMEQVMNAYLAHVLSPDDRTLPAGKFDLFATEGATMSMVYIFNSLKENKLIDLGDHIAIMTPIFSPYLEIPALNDYQLVNVNIAADETDGWQYPDHEIDKLKDPKIKVLFVVNPTNPSGISIQKSTLKRLAEIVKNDRQDLIIITDTVYATFVKDFRSLVYEIPENTICVYSYSKYFGVTGWRLGLIMLHHDNIIDQHIARLPESDKALLRERYKSYSPDPDNIKFIDRLEVDSRDVALAHTGGLSGPQQSLMCLASIFELLDEKRLYRASIHGILAKRARFLHDALQTTLPESPHYTYYYVLLDLQAVLNEKFSSEFVNYFTENHTLMEFLYRLAQEKFTVCLPGVGFAGPKWSLRISMANLDDQDYQLIGQNINDLLNEYHDAWRTNQ